MPLATPAQQSWLHWFVVWQWPFGKGGSQRSLCLFCTIVLLGLLTYGTLYWFSLRYFGTWTIDLVHGTRRTRVRPVYKIENYLPASCRSSIRRYFKPAHQIDCWARPGLWSPSVEVLALEEQERYLSDMTPEELQELNHRKAQSLSDRSQNH